MFFIILDIILGMKYPVIEIKYCRFPEEKNNHEIFLSQFFCDSSPINNIFVKFNGWRLWKIQFISCIIRLINLCCWYFFSQQFASLNVKMADHAYFPTSASAMRDFMAHTANNVSKGCQQFQDLGWFGHLKMSC